MFLCCVRRCKLMQPSGKRFSKTDQITHSWVKFQLFLYPWFLFYMKTHHPHRIHYYYFLCLGVNFYLTESVISRWPLFALWWLQSESHILCLLASLRAKGRSGEENRYRQSSGMTTTAVRWAFTSAQRAWPAASHHCLVTQIPRYDQTHFPDGEIVPEWFSITLPESQGLKLGLWLQAMLLWLARTVGPHGHWGPFGVRPRWVSPLNTERPRPQAL